MNVEQTPQLFVGVLCLGLLNVVSLYEGSAPSLTELHRSPTRDDDSRQALMDADILIGGTALFVSIAASIALKSGYPFLFLFGGFVIASFWHHTVLNSPSY